MTSTDNTSKRIEDLLVQMLQNHEFELTPIHTPINDYESVQQAKSLIMELLIEELESLHIHYEHDANDSVIHTFKGLEQPELDKGMFSQRLAERLEQLQKGKL